RLRKRATNGSVAPSSSIAAVARTCAALIPSSRAVCATCLSVQLLAGIRLSGFALIRFAKERRNGVIAHERGDLGVRPPPHSAVVGDVIHQVLEDGDA